MNKESYKECIEKQASIGSTLVSAASKVIPTIAKGTKAFTSMGTGKRALIGAGANATIKGLTYKPVEGADNVKGRIGAMVGGATSGAILGGLASSSRVSNLGSKVSDVGEKVFNKASAGAVMDKASDIVGNAGIYMNDAGNKIKNYFGN